MEKKAEIEEYVERNWPEIDEAIKNGNKKLSFPPTGTWQEEYFERFAYKEKHPTAIDRFKMLVKNHSKNRSRLGEALKFEQNRLDPAIRVVRDKSKLNDRKIISVFKM